MEHVDVLICGSGSAGLCAATWLARRGIRCKILESRSGPLKIGQADGVQCRTVEVFDSFNIAEELLREAYHMSEVTFWSPDSTGGIARTGRTADREPGVSHQPHLILNQARMNSFLIEAMHRFNAQTIDYGYTVKDVRIDSETRADPEAYCVEVQAEKDTKVEFFKAKYVLGCDGAHSTVRKSLGYKMVGDTTDSIWGVMDIYPRTDFPDIRKKAALQSDRGSLLVIPREGGSLCRFYVELPQGTVPANVSLLELHATARSIFSPYTLDIADTFWWSVYSIGQRLTNGFSKDNRVFLTGDACHTHSPKAGQGMNVSFQDGYNLGWKLAAVLKGQVDPQVLQTYDVERGKVAADLIEFDRVFMKAFAAKRNTENASQNFADIFIKAGRYTAGLTARYEDTALTCSHRSIQTLATNLQVGMRFPSTQVVRLCDAKAMHLVKALPADGRWRVVIFPGNIADSSAARRLREFADYLESLNGPVRTHTAQGEDIDSFIEPIVVLIGDKTDIELTQLPGYFTPITGKWQMRDIHKIFVDDESYNDGHGKAYEFYGVNQERGAAAVVRPDQYVSMVVALDRVGCESLGDFFRSFCVRR